MICFVIGTRMGAVLVEVFGLGLRCVHRTTIGMKSPLTDRRCYTRFHPARVQELAFPAAKVSFPYLSATTSDRAPFGLSSYYLFVKSSSYSAPLRPLRQLAYIAGFAVIDRHLTDIAVKYAWRQSHFTRLRIDMLDSSCPRRRGKNLILTLMRAAIILT